MKLLFFSGNRADWSGLEWLSSNLARHGHECITYKFWESYEGKPNTPSQVAELAGLSFHEASNRLGGVDLVFLLGDRYEVLAAAQAAYLMEVPIAHIGGGDVTLGSADNAMRDAITMLASLHFATNYGSAGRLFKLGQVANVWGGVHMVGSPAVDRIISMRPNMDKVRASTAARELTHGKHLTVIVSVHPSLDYDVGSIVGDVLAAVRQFDCETDRSYHFHLIAPNVDAGNSDIAEHMSDFCRKDIAFYHENLSPDDFIGFLSRSTMIVGNSSAGVYEAPVLGVPSVNVGDRQTGRYLAPSVIQTPVDRSAILSAMIDASRRTERTTSDYYGNGAAWIHILNALSHIKDPKSLLKRRRHARDTTLSGSTDQRQTFQLSRESFV